MATAMLGCMPVGIRSAPPLCCTFFPLLDLKSSKVPVANFLIPPFLCLFSDNGMVEPSIAALDEPAKGSSGAQPLPRFYVATISKQPGQQTVIVRKLAAGC